MVFLIYQLILILIILISPLIILYRILKNKEDSVRFREKFCFFSKSRKSGKLIWFHASSVGELMSILPIINYYENKKNINQILITSTTLSSAKILKKIKLKKTIHQFFPLDLIFFSRIFLNYWKPSMAIFVESEIWPSMYKFINKRKIPLILLNARITKKTFNRWYFFKKYSLSIFKNISASYPQNIETINYLKKLKVKIIKYIGNLKFIGNPYENKKEFEKTLKSRLKKHLIWVAASTHDNEEILCAEAHMILKRKFKNLITIIIPRHINRVDKIFSDLKKKNLNIALHSSGAKDLKNVDIYLVDEYGLSENFYKISKTVFLGGSLINRGGQNPLEPARYGARILSGKNTKNFVDIYKFLKSLGISMVVNNPIDIAKSIVFKSNKNGGEKIKILGNEILKKTTIEIDKILNNAIKKT
ncbi:MAG: 3-deoxy-D-manno-octulosonic acid transferase [Pelagibacteraceae bacterium BACL5 MAG-121015-bin10]|nr:MAG: 3-deoxy-D-manno-octulosonic acid transferase [Pelagibacteraceae bacterium BACL5 MAG-121015-bin10]